MRYTLDADEAMRREAVAAESAGDEVAEPSASDSRAAPTESGTGRYVIQLTPTRFWWHWAVFDDLSVGDDPALALRSFDAVASSAVPRWSARSARRAAERAVRQATARPLT